MPRIKKLAFFLISLLFVFTFTLTAKVYAGAGDWVKIDEWNAEYMQMFDGECEKLSNGIKLSNDLGFNSFIGGNTCSISEVSFYTKSNGGDVSFGWVNGSDARDQDKGTSMWIFKSKDIAEGALGKMVEQLKQIRIEGDAEYAKENPSVQITVIEDLEEDAKAGDGGKLFKYEFQSFEPSGVISLDDSSPDIKLYGAQRDLLYSLGRCVVQIRGNASSDSQGGLDANKTILEEKMAEFADKSVEGLKEACEEEAIGGTSFNFPFLNLGTFILVLTIIFVLFLFKTGVHLPVVIVIAVVGVLISLYSFGMLNLGLLTKDATELSQTKLSPGSSWLSKVDLTKCDQIAKRSKLSDVIVVGPENKGPYKCIAGARDIGGTVGYLDRDGDIKIRLNALNIDAIFDDEGVIDSKVSDERQFGNPAPGNAPTALASSKYWDKKYDDIFEEVEFLADVPGIIAGLSDGTVVIAKKGTFETSEGKGAYVIFPTYDSFAKAKKGHCIISMEITTEVDSNAYDPENPSDGDIDTGVDSGKTKTEKLTIELMQDMVKAVGDVCGS